MRTVARALVHGGIGTAFGLVFACVFWMLSESPVQFPRITLLGTLFGVLTSFCIVDQQEEDDPS